MFRTTLTTLRRSVEYERKLRRKFHGARSMAGAMPLQQTLKQRQDTIGEIAKKTSRGAGLSDPARHRHIEERLFSSGARAQRQGMALNKTYALQGLGDLEPLSGSASFGLSEATVMKYDNVSEMSRYEAPPVPFTPLAARKLAEGNFWPSAPEPNNLTSKEVQLLKHEKNMSPSAAKFSTAVEYYLRRDLKSCPAHIAEAIDFSQLIIEEAFASRRSKKLYIVWSTVHPGARFEVEPHLLKLNRWVQQMIMQRIKNRPNIPSIAWIYNGGSLQRELPRDLRENLEATLAENASTLEDRVRYLKQMDSLDARMKSIPWFMPYLWSKEKKMQQSRTMNRDLEEFDRRKKETAAGAAGGTARSDPAPMYTR